MTLARSGKSLYAFKKTWKAQSSRKSSYMSVYQIDPLQDRRWTEFVDAHPQASVFHMSSWLKALHRNYGYQPLAFTTSPPGAELKDGIVFCHVDSWFTGKRLVSVPFADHCSPLVNRAESLYEMLECIARTKGLNVRYIEIRPLGSDACFRENTSFREQGQFRIHSLDLRPALDVILKSFHKDSVQRRILHAERANLLYEKGSSRELLKKFYYLFVQTSRRHGVPPKSMQWYEDLLAAFKERGQIRVASKMDVPIAAILTLSHNGTVTYKYGGSEKRYHSFAGIPFLLWRAILEAKKAGAHTFDMGRSDLDNPGLIVFKSKWGTVNSPLTYWRCPAQGHGPSWSRASLSSIGGYVLSKLPNGVVTRVGEVLYKHVG